MPANKKPKKKYRPKPVLKDPVSFAVEGVQSASANPSVVSKLSLRMHDAYLRLREGKATGSEMDALITAHNIMQSLKVMKYGEGVLEPYHHYTLEGKVALIGIGSRHDAKLGRFVATGPELMALKNMVEALDELLSIMSLQVLEKASALARREVLSPRSLPTYKFHNLIGEENEVQDNRPNS